MLLFGLEMENKTFAECLNLQTVVMVIWISCCVRYSIGLKCQDCVGACINPGTCETDGKCFVRRDVNGYLYRGCADVERWQGLDHTYLGCGFQDYLGYAGQRVLWCFCDSEECNKNSLSTFPQRKIRDDQPEVENGNDKEVPPGGDGTLRNRNAQPTALPVTSTRSSLLKPRELNRGVLNDLSNPSSPATLVNTLTSESPSLGTLRTVQTTKPPYTRSTTYRPIKTTQKVGFTQSPNQYRPLKSIQSTKGIPENLSTISSSTVSLGSTNVEVTTPRQVPQEDYKQAAVTDRSDTKSTNGETLGTTRPSVGRLTNNIVSPPVELPSGGSSSNREGDVVIADVCPAYFEPVPQFTSCYRLFREALTFNDARRKCQQLAPSGDLITMETNGEYLYIVSRIKQEPALLNRWQGWWTSGKYNDRIREFTWLTSGHVISRMDLRWQKSLLIQPYLRTCVWLVPLSRLKLGNYACKQKAGYICEVPFGR